MWGFGRAVKRIGRGVEGTVRGVGRGIESALRESASGVKTMLTHPGSAIKAEGARLEGRVRGGVIKAGKQTEAEVKRAGDKGPIGSAKRGVQRNVQSEGEPAAPPAPPPPAPMPIPDEALSLVARRRQRAQRRGARSSSILSGNQETLG